MKEATKEVVKTFEDNKYIKSVTIKFEK